jgi:hypothetical protein
MGNYYRCCIPSLGDENAHIAFYALPIALASVIAVDWLLGIFVKDVSFDPG